MHPQVGPLSGRTAVVTGSSSGNGRTIALMLANRGATVVCSDLQSVPVDGGFERDPSVATHDLIRERGGHSSFRQADVSVPEQIDDLASHAIDEFGRIDVWVNNAGVVTAGSLESETGQDWDRNLNVNLKGTWLGCRAAADRMRNQERMPRSRGHIVNIGSVAGLFGNAALGAYSSSKGAVHSLTRALATELGPDGINVNAVVPGFLPTQMNRPIWDNEVALAAIVAATPLHEAGLQEDIAAAVAFLSSSDSDWITGVLLPVDGGFAAVGAYSAIAGPVGEAFAGGGDSH